MHEHNQGNHEKRNKSLRTICQLRQQPNSKTDTSPPDMDGRAHPMPHRQGRRHRQRVDTLSTWAHRNWNGLFLFYFKTEQQACLPPPSPPIALPQAAHLLLIFTFLHALPQTNVADRDATSQLHNPFLLPRVVSLSQSPAQTASSHVHISSWKRINTSKPEKIADVKPALY